MTQPCLNAKWPGCPAKWADKANSAEKSQLSILINKDKAFLLQPTREWMHYGGPTETSDSSRHIFLH